MLSRSDRRGLRPRDRSDSGRTVCGAGELAWPALPRGRQGGAVTVMLEEATAEWTSSLRDLPFEKETLLFSALFRRLTKRFRSEVHGVVSVPFIVSIPLD